MATNKSQSTVTTLDNETPDTQADATASAPEATQVRGANHDAELCGETVMLTIHASDSDGGQDAVKVGVNGYMYQIPRNTPCKVPVEVAGVIKTAVVEQIRLSADGKSHVTQNVPRYAYSLG